jgi:hypothetical protein
METPRRTPATSGVHGRPRARTERVVPNLSRDSRGSEVASWTSRAAVNWCDVGKSQSEWSAKDGTAWHARTPRSAQEPSEPTPQRRSASVRSAERARLRSSAPTNASTPAQAFSILNFRDKNRCGMGKSQPKWTAKDGNAWRTVVAGVEVARHTVAQARAHATPLLLAPQRVVRQVQLGDGAVHREQRRLPPPD